MRTKNSFIAIDRVSAAIGLVTVLAANWLYLSGLGTILDPMMSMEPFYIDMAQRPVLGILTQDPGWGPLYGLWLKPFVALLGDPILVYQANLWALSLGIATMIYVYLLLLIRRPIIAAATALLFLVSDFNVPLYSKVSGFALLVVLASLTAAELCRDAARRATVVAVGVLVASYVRPEIYPSSICLLLAALLVAYRESDRKQLTWPLSGVVLLLALALLLGTPVFSSRHPSERLWMALREHFAWNWSQWHDERASFIAIWDQEFGEARTLTQAFLHNPTAMLHHLTSNFIGTLSFMLGRALGHYPLLAPVTSPLLVEAENLALSVACWGSLLAVSVRTDLRRAFVGRYGRTLACYAVIAVSCFASTTVIYPAPYYLAIPGGLLMMAGALAVSTLAPAIGDASRRTCLLAGLVGIVAIPKPFALPSAYVVPGSPFKGRIIVARRVTDTVEFVRSLDLGRPVHVLTLTDGIGAMLGAGFEESKAWERGDLALADYIRNQRIDLIVSLEPGRDSFAVDDPYWILLQNNPEAAGFRRLAVPNHDSVHLFVRAGASPGP